MSMVPHYGMNLNCKKRENQVSRGHKHSKDSYFQKLMDALILELRMKKSQKRFMK